MKITRQWAMPNSNTFDVEPIRQLITKYARGVIVDPFANQNKIATITNDLNPAYDTTYHMDATDFLKMLAALKIIIPDALKPLYKELKVKYL